MHIFGKGRFNLKDKQWQPSSCITVCPVHSLQGGPTFVRLYSSAKRWSSGLVNFVTALALPAAFTQPGNHLPPFSRGLYIFVRIFFHTLILSSLEHAADDNEEVVGHQDHEEVVEHGLGEHTHMTSMSQKCTKTLPNFLPSINSVY